MIQPIPKRKVLNLTPGKFYQVEVLYTHSYDSTSKGRKKEKLELKYMYNTETLYIFEHDYGKKECFSIYTPEPELKIKLA